MRGRFSSSLRITYDESYTVMFHVLALYNALRQLLGLGESVMLFKYSHANSANFAAVFFSLQEPFGSDGGIEDHLPRSCLMLRVEKSASGDGGIFALSRPISFHKVLCFSQAQQKRHSVS